MELGGGGVVHAVRERGEEETRVGVVFLAPWSVVAWWGGCVLSSELEGDGEGTRM